MLSETELEGTNIVIVEAKYCCYLCGTPIEVALYDVYFRGVEFGTFDGFFTVEETDIHEQRDLEFYCSICDTSLIIESDLLETIIYHNTDSNSVIL